MKSIILLLVFITFSVAISAEKPIEGKDGVVQIESESTTSKLGKWKLNKTVNNYTGEGHLEFTGNQPMSGKADSPLKYKFTVDKDGNYGIYIRGFKRLDGAPKDQCNDCFIRLEGDFESGNDIPKDILTLDQKFFIHGKSDIEWDWATTMEYAHPKKKDIQGKKSPLYKLKKGEVYTLIISGRSQRFNMDKILFISDELNVKKELAKQKK